MQPVAPKSMKYKPTIATFDFSLNSTGVCIHDGPLMWTETIACQRKDDPAYDKMLRIRRRVEVLLDKVQPDIVVLEGYVFGRFANIYLAELGGLIRVLLWERRIKTLVIPPTSLKAFVFGKAKAVDKRQMQKAMLEKGWTKRTVMPVKPSSPRRPTDWKNGDESDAFALAVMAFYAEGHYLFHIPKGPEYKLLGAVKTIIHATPKRSRKGIVNN